MDLIDEEDRANGRAEYAPLLALDTLEHFTYILHTRVYGTERMEGSL